jgi:hypothetical protein
MQKLRLGAMRLAVGLILVIAWSCAGKDLPLVDKETLKGWLSDPQVLILDVRAGKDWHVSDKKIRGAVRQDPNEVKTWAANLPRDKKIVLC